METKPNRWEVDDAYASRNKFKKFSERHGREYDSLFANLDKILDILNSGHKVGSFGVGFFRSESDGVFRIGQKHFPGAKESRLYVYPDPQTLKVYLLGIGTKETQSDDINEAKKTVEVIRAGGQANEHVPNSGGGGSSTSGKPAS
ncbi:MAG: hypothetical protein ABSG14_07630 [Verrucomicrobiia bacterium]|jgi:putative component of toxin-antitoxin plasmid stabilization module